MSRGEVRRSVGGGHAHSVVISWGEAKGKMGKRGGITSNSTI